MVCGVVGLQEDVRLGLGSGLGLGLGLGLGFGLWEDVRFGAEIARFARHFLFGTLGEPLEELFDLPEDS